MSDLAAGRERRFAFLQRPGAWFWVAVACGAAARLYLAFASAGSADVELWSLHASNAAKRGLMRCYALSPLFIHPPPISWAMARLWDLCVALGISFAIAFRVLLSLVDLLNALLIARALRTSRWRWLAAAAYAIAPATILLSGQHGNTDVAIATLVLGASLCAAGCRPIAAGALVGLTAWLKLPGLVAAPAIGFAFPRWRERALCAMTAAIVALAPFVWALGEAELFAREHPRFVPSGGNVVWERVVGYRGRAIEVPGEQASWMWGLRNFSALAFGPDASNWPPWVRSWHEHNAGIALVFVTLFAFLRRRATSVRDIAVTLTGAYAIFYAAIDNWATQYLAWSLPFAVIAGWRTGVLFHVVAGGYVYALYAWVTNDWLARGEWHYMERPGWPAILFVLRDASLLVFVAVAAVAFVRAESEELAAWRERRRHRIPATA